MDILIKTILGKIDELYYRYIEDLLTEDRRELLSEQEVEMIEYLKETYDEAGKFPTEDYFIKQFPEYSIPLSSAEEVNKHDLDVHFEKMISKRSKQAISRELMKASSIVSEEGFTDEIKEDIEKIYRLNRQIELDDAVFDIGSIREIYQKKKEEPQGLLTFIDEVDQKIGGLSYGTVNVIFGFTGHYKTLISTNIAYGNAYKLGYNVVIVSLEVPKEDIIYNILSRHSFEAKFTEYPYIGHERIRKLELSEEEEDFIFNRVLNDFENESEGNLIILDETDFKAFTFPDIRKRLEVVDEKIGGIDAIIWDHANLFKFNNKPYMTQNDIINEYVSWIRGIGIKWLRDDEGKYRQLCNIIVAQANREGWKKAVRNDGRYNLTAIAEANELERSAYRIFSTFTNEELKQSKEAKVQILKNRSGPTMYEPASVFVDPVAYVAGEEVQGFNDTINTEDFDSAFLDEGEELI